MPFTVCDHAAQEVCPIWPGQPMTAHWGIADPAAATGSDEDKRRAFNRAFRDLDARIKIFTSLRLEALDQLSLQRQLDDIGKTVQDARAEDLTSQMARLFAELLETRAASRLLRHARNWTQWFTLPRWLTPPDPAEYRRRPEIVEERVHDRHHQQGK